MRPRIHHVITAAAGHPFELDSVNLSGGNTSTIFVTGVDVNGHTISQTVTVADVGTLGGAASTLFDTTGTAFAGVSRAGQLAIAGRLTVGSSLNGAMVSSVMYRAL